MHRFNARVAPVAAAVLSGLLLANTGSLHPVWIVAWIASVPVLVAAYKGSGRSAWALGVTAGLIGGLSIFGYYAAVAGIPGALVITVAKALLYAGGIHLAWRVRQRLPAWIAVFAFPAWFAAFDTLIATWSIHGTAGSPAYSQMNFPVAVQVASLGGVPAVTFVVYLFSSALAHAIVAIRSTRRELAATLPALLLVAGSLGFGLWRISSAGAEPRILVAAAALDQESALPGDWRASVQAYRTRLSQARDQKIELLALPEELAIASTADVPAIRTELGGFARDARMNVAVGFRIADEAKLRNVLLVFTADGRMLSYDKQHLVPGFEIPRITPGSAPALIAEIGGHRIGGAICKDFDFVDIGRSLGIARAGLVVAPAWDFGQDAWLHGRMAMLRAVEGGFTLLRSARGGTMSVSDRFGRVLAEAPSGPSAPLLVVLAPVSGFAPTIYARAGDVFGWVCAGFVLLLIASGFRSLRGRA